MSELSKYVDEAQTQTLNAFEQFAKSQEEVLTAIKEAAVAIQEEVPTPAQLLESSFSFVSKVFDVQKRYTLKLVDAFTPSKS